MKLDDFDKKGVVIAVVPGSKGNWYEIRADENRVLSCNCIGFMTRKKCKHINKYQEEVNNGTI